MMFFVPQFPVILYIYQEEKKIKFFLEMDHSQRFHRV